MAFQGMTIAEEEEDPLLSKHKLSRSKGASVNTDQSTDTATIKKLHVSSANLQRVSNVTAL